jgi:hypothetical protein
MKDIAIVVDTSPWWVKSIFTHTTGNFNIIILKHMQKMKDIAIVGDTGHFDESKVREIYIYIHEYHLQLQNHYLEAAIGRSRQGAPWWTPAFRPWHAKGDASDDDSESTG